MSQWDGLPEPGPVALYGKKGRKAQERLRDAVVAAQKPATVDQARAISEAREAIPAEVVGDPEFRPAERVAEIEGQLVEHVEALSVLCDQLATWKGAMKWTEDVRVPYRPVTAVSGGPAMQQLRRPGSSVSAATLVAALREVLGIAGPAEPVRLVPDFSRNEYKNQNPQVGRQYRTRDLGAPAA